MSRKLYLPRRSKFQLVFLRDDSLIFSFASRMIDFEGILSSLLILCLICSNNNCAAFLPISKVGCSTLVKLGSTINASFDSEKPTTAISSCFFEEFSSPLSPPDHSLQRFHPAIFPFQESGGQPLSLFPSLFHNR